MKTNVFFVRHAQPDISIKDDMLRPLNEKGIEDTKLVSKALKDKNLDLIFSSPYKRAVDTVKDLSKATGLEIGIIEDFRERKVTDGWIEDFKAYSRSQWEDFEYKLTNGECLREVQERNINALMQIIVNNPGKNVVVGTHGTAMSTIINYFNKDFGYDQFWSIIDKMPYIVCLTFEGTEFKGMSVVEI